MSEKINKNVELDGESKIGTENMEEKQAGEVNEGNPVVKAQKQISSQRTVGVFTPE